MDYWSEKLLYLLETTPKRRLHISDLRSYMLAETGLISASKLEARLKMLDRAGYIEVVSAVVQRTEKALPASLALTIELEKKFGKAGGY